MTFVNILLKILEEKKYTSDIDSMSKNYLHLVKMNEECHLVGGKKLINIILNRFHNFIHFLNIFVCLSLQRNEYNSKWR